VVRRSIAHAAAIPPYMATQLSLRLRRTPDALQGRVAAVFRSLSYGLQPLSLLLTGVLLERTGAVTTVVALFVPQLLLALMATLHPALRPPHRGSGASG
jgi:hypothetical protein